MACPYEGCTNKGSSYFTYEQTFDAPDYEDSKKRAVQKLTFCSLGHLTKYIKEDLKNKDG